MKHTQGRTRRGRGTADRLQRLLRAMARLHRARDVDGLTRAILAAARDVVACDGAAFFLREGPYSRCVGEDTVTPVWRDRDRPLEACIAGRAMADGRPFVAEDVTAGAVLPRGVHLHGDIRGLAVVPVGDVEAVAALALFWRKPRPTCADDLSLLEAFGEAVGAAHENLRRYQDIERVTHQMAVARDAAEDRLNDVAGKEEMTGLLNRAGFYEAARKAVLTAPCALVFIDVDGLKMVNDSLGHAAGDQLLLGFADILRGFFRRGDVLGRMGGDEFCVLVPNPTVDEDGLRRTFQTRLDEFNETSGLPFMMAASLGATVCPKGAPSLLEALVEEADNRMYTDKQARRRRRLAGGR